jgi:dTDP-glucose 4,6-dehydratase
MMRCLVTGGCGFIGSNFIRHMLEKYPDYFITNLDSLTYAGNPQNLTDISNNTHYNFVKGDICDKNVVAVVLKKNNIDTIIHFAAESHVDRSISDASSFIKTNVLGTFTLLNQARKLGIRRFIHVSTDEVYGSINEGSFSERDILNPSSPYSSSKASSDLLARSYFITHHLPVIITRCTNNFGPYQYPEKLIPFFITNLLNGKNVPLYGSGLNVRDWIYVLDHCVAIDLALHSGEPGQIYNIGSGEEISNIEITKKIIKILGTDESLIEYVQDRLGHDFRYSLDFTKLRMLGWKPTYKFDTALEGTVQWYIDNDWWWQPLRR